MLSVQAVSWLYIPHMALICVMMIISVFHCVLIYGGSVNNGSHLFLWPIKERIFTKKKI